MLRGACASWTRRWVAACATEELAEEGADPAADQASPLTDQPDHAVHDAGHEALEEARDDLLRADHGKERVGEEEQGDDAGDQAQDVVL